MKFFKNITVKYNTIVLDPPWDIPMSGITKTRPNRSRELAYNTMSIDEIKNMPIKDIAQVGAHVYMWTTNKMLEHTWGIFEKWGVNYHLTLVWVKPNGIPPCFAYKFATEFLVLGFFGKPMQKFSKNVQLNWLKATSGKHSEKPVDFYNLIKEMSPSPRMDIFARKRHDGFESWGLEVEEDGQRFLSDFALDDWKVNTN